MKKIYLLLLLFGVFAAQAQTPVSNPDKDYIVQQCLEFQPLINKIPLEVKAMMADYYILGNNLGADFSQDLIVNGKKITFLTKADLSPTKPFFMFFTLNVSSDRASVRYYFTSTTNGIETTLPVTIEFKKNNSLWQVFQYTI